jgi:hypothetical protein
MSPGSSQVPSSPRPQAKVIRFGEYLVEHKVLDRSQLLTALMAQDDAPGVPLGEVVCALGIAPASKVEAALASYLELEVVEY